MHTANHARLSPQKLKMTPLQLAPTPGREACRMTFCDQLEALTGILALG